MKIGIVIGTRPEFIKMSPILDYCKKHGVDFFTVHSGQHYSYSIYEKILKDLNLDPPKYDLGVRSSSPLLQSEHIGRIMTVLGNVMIDEKPDIVMVHGDTNTTLAGALCVRKLNTSNFNIRLYHVESGLRSFDRSMPEEINRVIADHMSDVLFAPTETSRANIINEGIKNRIIVTGNTIVDVIESRREKFLERDLLDRLGLEKNNYFLLTLHRVENVDVKENFCCIMDAMESLHKKYSMEIIYPIHPRSKKMLDIHKISVPRGIRIIEPLGVNDFMHLEHSARLILTDSGGVQEESCCMKVPCVTIRNNTERPETLMIGSNKLGGTRPETIIGAADVMMESNRHWDNPFGDGKAAKRIMEFCINGD